MDPELASIIEKVVNATISSAAIGGLAILGLNAISYAATIDVARRQEQWKPEEFQQKCEDLKKRVFMEQRLVVWDRGWRE